jgi:serine O-acetyltransferase
MKPTTKKQLPSKKRVIALTKKLIYKLFPNFDGGKEIIVSDKKLEKIILKVLKSIQEDLQKNREDVAKDFLEKLPLLRLQLQSDAQFIEANDPATTCIEEVIMTYPGFYAIMVYRLANTLSDFGVELIPRIMTEHAHSVTGIDIHPKATIGRDFFIDHGTGIVIGETAIIGDRVKIYQGVTIGALSVCKDQAQNKRHPTIEDDVVIYAGATILGGKTTIGSNSIIGGNVWLTKSVEPNSVVQHENRITVKQKRYSLN